MCRAPRLVIAHSPESVQHHIIVPPRDVALFRRLAGPRAQIHRGDRVPSRSFRPVPGMNFSLNLRRPFPPLRGWTCSRSSSWPRRPVQTPTWRCWWIRTSNSSGRSARIRSAAMGGSLLPEARRSRRPAPAAHDVAPRVPFTSRPADRIAAISGLCLLTHGMGSGGRAEATRQGAVDNRPALVRRGRTSVALSPSGRCTASSWTRSWEGHPAGSAPTTRSAMRTGMRFR